MRLLSSFLLIYFVRTFAWQTLPRLFVRKIPTEVSSTPRLENIEVVQPLKTIVFVDGSWLYYSLMHNREGDLNPALRKFGTDWSSKYRFEPAKLLEILRSNLEHQLIERCSCRKSVDLIKANVFTSTKPDTIIGSPRDLFISSFSKNPLFDLHIFESKPVEEQEKCVDVAMAVEMVFLATVPNAFDLAVVVTGDKDFLPAIQKTRLLAKQVAICSMRNSCNKELIQSRNIDFNLIWLEDAFDELLQPRLTSEELTDADLVARILKIIRSYYDPGLTISSRDFGRLLAAIDSESEKSLLDCIRNRYGSLKSFLNEYPTVFNLSIPPIPSDQWEFGIRLCSSFTNDTLDCSKFVGLLDDPDAARRHIDDATVLQFLLKVFADLPDQKISGRALGKALNAQFLPCGKNFLDEIKSKYRSTRLFLERYPNYFIVGPTVPSKTGFEFNVTLNSSILSNDIPPLKSGRDYCVCVESILKIVGSLPSGNNVISNRDLGRALTMINVSNDQSILDVVKERYHSLRSLLEDRVDLFQLGEATQIGSAYEYLIHVNESVLASYKDSFAATVEANLLKLEDLARQFAKHQRMQGKNVLTSSASLILSHISTQQGERCLNLLRSINLPIPVFLSKFPQYFELGRYELSSNGYERRISFI